jgi:hypothetical protein
MITSYRDTSGHPWALYYMRPAWNRRKAHQQRYVPAPGPGTCNACRKSIDRGRFYWTATATRWTCRPVTATATPACCAARAAKPRGCAP